MARSCSAALGLEIRMPPPRRGILMSEVGCRYKVHRDGEEKRMPLSPHDFLDRWFEHVPPRALRMIRRSGLYSNSSGAIRERVREQLAAESVSSQATSSVSAASSEVCPLDRERCPLCNTCVSVTVVYRPSARVFSVVRQAHVYSRPP